MTFLARTPSLAAAVLLGAIAWLGGAPPATAATASLRCDSVGYQYQYCPMPTANQVVLQRQRSRSPCRQGDTWGFDAGGVWVTQGCAADFRVGGKPGAAPADGAPGPLDPRAPTAGLPPGTTPSPGVPATRWAHAAYVGRLPGEAGEVRLTVGGDGSVKGSSGERSFTGRITDTWLLTDRARYRLQPSGLGFAAADERNPRAQTQLDLVTEKN